MAVTPRKIEWLAGLLEGEGCFHLGRIRNERAKRWYAEPKIQLVMTDEDVLRSAAALLDATVTVPNWKLKSGKTAYRAVLYGPHAIGWMMTLYSLMGNRRKEKIRECVSAWKSSPGKPQLAKYFRRHGVTYGR